MCNLDQYSNSIYRGHRPTIKLQIYHIRIVLKITSQEIKISTSTYHCLVYETLILYCLDSANDRFLTTSNQNEKTKLKSKKDISGILQIQGKTHTNQLNVDKILIEVPVDDF